MVETKEIEKLPEGWRRARLGESAEIKTGSTNVQDAVEGGDILYLIDL